MIALLGFPIFKSVSVSSKGVTYELRDASSPDPTAAPGDSLKFRSIPHTFVFINNTEVSDDELAGRFAEFEKANMILPSKLSMHGKITVDDDSKAFLLLSRSN
jgi:hypothetical protein